MGAQALPVAGRRDRVFYTGMAAVAALVVFVGFSRTYFLKPYFATPPLPSTLVHVHGLLFTSWIVLFAAQASLVAARRVDVHRRLGVAGAVLAASMIVVGAWTAIAAAKRGHGAAAGPPPLVFLVIPIGDIVVFTILAGAAFLLRRRTEAHKRLMLVGTLGLLTAAIARWPFAFILANGPLAFFGLTDALLLACLAYDFATRGRVHPAFAWSGLLLVASQPLRLMLGGTSAWLAFAGWLTG